VRAFEKFKEVSGENKYLQKFKEKLKNLKINKMKREGLYFFSNLFGSREGRKAEPVAEEQEIIVTSFSQPHVLREKMKQHQMTHGETIMANMSPVRLENSIHGMTLYFCPMENLDIVKTIQSGDGQEIPMEAKVEGFSVPLDFKAGLYALKNVKVTSNGTMQVLATADTTWENMSLTREL
jgi:hypothetical protein